MTRARKPVASTVIELVVIVAAALGIALAVQAFIVKPYRIPSGSMLPTLRVNQRILVNRLGADFSNPHLGDIIVFHPPKNYNAGCEDQSQGVSQDGESDAKPCAVAQTERSSQTFVKRVVGLPGDRLRIVDGHVYRNGAREKDPYIVPCGANAASCSFSESITVPKGDYYMMGDNRPDSDDSRFWGPVPRAWIIGKAFFTYWPPTRFGFL